MRKKAMIFILEGPSDDTSLTGSLKHIFASSRIEPLIMHGDITSDRNVTNRNIIRKLHEEIKAFCNKNFLTKGNILRIVHIIDTDGAFIPDELIQEEPGCSQIIYSEDNIRCSSKENLIRRNHIKQQNVQKLLDTHNIGRLPYSVYYMSSNLEHVLHNSINLTDEEKEELSYEFAEICAEKPEYFIQLMTSQTVFIDGSYRESWDFIKSGKHSLERHSNLALCFHGSFGYESINDH
jgi:hypothetical protein